MLIASMPSISHHGENFFGILTADERNQFPFVGYIQRIEPENFACALDVVTHRDRRLADQNSTRRSNASRLRHSQAVVQFRISGFGFEIRPRPISKFSRSIILSVL